MYKHFFVPKYFRTVFWTGNKFGEESFKEVLLQNTRLEGNTDHKVLRIGRKFQRICDVSKQGFCSSIKPNFSWNSQREERRKVFLKAKKRSQRHISRSGHEHLHVAMIKKMNGVTSESKSKITCPYILHEMVTNPFLQTVFITNLPIVQVDPIDVPMVSEDVLLEATKKVRENLVPGLVSIPKKALMK